MQVQSADPGVYVLEHFGPDVLAAFSGREFTAARRPEFLKRLGILPDSLRTVRQVHGSQIIGRGQYIQKDCEADGLATAEPGMALGIFTADCIPAFYWDPVRRAAGLAHAGWRGVQKGILEGMVAYMREHFQSKPRDLQIVFGPSIRACCYEVGPEFESHFPGFYQAPSAPADKGRMDLAAAARHKLLHAGVAASQVCDTEICTACRSTELFSARREQTPERILSVIQIRA